jgi:AcrR family transcriptional regulator
VRLPDRPADSRLSTIPRSAAQMRIITAALELFSRHGVNGTSLQMIADAIGVTKAAVYHQYPTKDEIVIATAEVELVRLEVALDAAEAEPSRSAALDVLLTRVIDLAVERRRMVSTLQGDPVIVRLLAEHEPFQDLMERLYRVVIGDDAGAEAAVPAAMMSAAIGGAVIHPLVVGLDDDTLRSELLKLTRRLFGLDHVD